MKFYHSPSFSMDKTYYALYSSIMLLLLSLYFIYTKKGTLTLRILLFIVGLISTIHHCRTYDDEDYDIFKIIDWILVAIFGLYILYLYQNRTTFIVLLVISVLILYLQLKSKPSKTQSLLNSFIHILVAMILLLNNSTVCTYKGG